MKRIKGFEWEDQPWFPAFLRQYMMDFLRFVLNKGNLYQPVTSLLIKGLQQTGSRQIIDLCSGSGGAVQSIQQNIQKATGQIFPFTLTDLYPNPTAYESLQKNNKLPVTYYHQPVDATKVPASLQGFRTLFSGFHHFDKDMAKRVLQDATEAGEGIAIFDGGSRSLWFIAIILLFHPIAFIFFTPFIKPFSLRRLFFTYLVPVVPVCTIWDGVVSVLRLYLPDELLQLSSNVHNNHLYTWQSGVVTNQAGIPVAYLIGCPADRNDA